MPKQISKTVYMFDELSDEAKEKARNWWREGSCDDEWWDSVYEDAAMVAERLGIDLRRKPVKLMGGGTRYDPAIYFSGFSSQGDGACFEGTYRYRKGSVKAIKAYCNDAELIRIAKGLAKLQRHMFYGITASIVTSGRHLHAYSMDIAVDYGCNGRFATAAQATAVREYLRDFANWIYRTLEKEWDYQNADEQVDENIRINEYEFEEDGRRA